MEIPDFLKFEKKKMIIPIILIILLSLVLILNAMYSAQLSKDVHEITQDSLDILKLAVYNASLNGTDKQIENYLVIEQAKSEGFENRFMNLVIPSFVSYASEYTLDTFGTNFCFYIEKPNSPFLLNSPYLMIKQECVATELDLIVPAEIYRSVICTSNFTATFGKYLHDYPEKAGEFVYSDMAGKMFNEFWGCKISVNDLVDSEKSRGVFSVFSGAYVGSILYYEVKGDIMPKIRLITPVDIFLYYITVVVTGYIISCFVLWVHRKNDIIYKKGKKVYLIIIGLFILLIYVFMNFRAIQDIRLMIIVSVVLAYLLTTVIWKVHFMFIERKISRNVSLRRKK